MFPFNSTRTHDRTTSAGRRAAKTARPGWQHLGQAALALIVCLTIIMSTVEPMLASKPHIGNNPVNAVGSHSYWLEDLVFGAVSIPLDIAALVENYEKEASWDEWAIDIGCTIVDVTAVLVPVLPAAAGSIRHANKVRQLENLGLPINSAEKLILRMQQSQRISDGAQMLANVKKGIDKLLEGDIQGAIEEFTLAGVKGVGYKLGDSMKWAYQEELVNVATQGTSTGTPS